MQIKFEKSFYKDLQKLNNPKLAIKLKETLLLFENSTSLNEIPNIKKLKTYKIYYRLRIGNYRLGFSYENDIITFIRFLPRKDIYKLFP